MEFSCSKMTRNEASMPRVVAGARARGLAPEPRFLIRLGNSRIVEINRPFVFSHIPSPRSVIVATNETQPM